jgi:hypothetical protein
MGKKLAGEKNRKIDAGNGSTISLTEYHAGIADMFPFFELPLSNFINRLVYSRQF